MNFSLSDDLGPTDRTRISAGPEKDYLGDYLSNRIDFEDSGGHPLSWILLGGRPASTKNGELSVQVFVTVGTQPARLRVYRLHRLATEIPFAFGNVFLPG